MATLSCAACWWSRRGRSRARRHVWVRDSVVCIGGSARREARAAVTIAHTIRMIVWHVLHDDVAYAELGADYYDQRNNPDMQKARLVRRLNELGYDVEISPAA